MSLAGLPVLNDVFGRDFRPEQFDMDKSDIVGCRFSNMQFGTIGLKPEYVKERC